MTYFVGTDLVYVPAFTEQLARPGSRFEAVFSSRELRLASTKQRREEHLAGRWAAKEAFIKAWSQSLFGFPPPLAPDAVDFSEIEVVADSFGRVVVEPRGKVREASGMERVQLSISHDGDYATATCIIER
ncbi:holo-ACP synthase [Corynebacterium sp. SCR221107]|uniref:holo-ACP synthase AcpS n=1 Tax=Corynebacterium sp. SCR221107 TaxID=3017361 RepID=UPI0022EC30E3|nr:holo-ACP synthase [Corynebacterium sp. SCR221107]WBT08271.1 holo-ACP synthase [Corynebacterium sp. SCR221107]